MTSVDMCDHGWPGSGCKKCFPKLMPEQLPETRFLEEVLLHHESGGLEGDGSDYAVKQARAELAVLKPVPEVDEDLRVLRAIMAAGDANKAYQYLDGTRDDYPSMVAGLAVLKKERPRYRVIQEPPVYNRTTSPPPKNKPFLALCRNLVYDGKSYVEVLPSWVEVHYCDGRFRRYLGASRVWTTHVANFDLWMYSPAKTEG